MIRLLECVPNFSEGRDIKKIDHIVSSIASVEGVRILNVDVGFDTNRTVVTFVGRPDKVREAAFRGIKKASKIIDMSKHTGAHPRIGATDVCPFIPIQNTTMDECVYAAEMLGERVGEELGIPVYLYELAARHKQRTNLAVIRRGEYEGLAQKMKDPAWKPDFGPVEFNTISGATAIGARSILVAFNINLNTRDARIASRIAGRLRAAGILKHDKTGQIVRKPGLFKECKAIGWYLKKYKRAQVSLNLTDYHVTPPHIVYEACKKLAHEEGVKVTGSELIGMIPLEAMLQAGDYYSQFETGPFISIEELIFLAVQKLGLEELSVFNKEFRIIEYGIEKNKFAMSSSS